MIYNAKIEWFLPELFKEPGPCQVKISGEEIRVDYDSSPWSWAGRDLGHGHYVLHSKEGGEATLHRFGDDPYLEGHCNQTAAGKRTMWRIKLGKLVGSKS